MTTALKVFEQPTQVERELQQDLPAFLSEAETLQVTTEQQYSYALDFAKIIKTTTKDVENERTKLTSPLNSVLKNLNARFKKYSEPLEKAESIVKRKITFYLSEQQRKQREEQEKIMEQQLEQARKQAELLAQQNKQEEAEIVKQQAEIIQAAPIVIEKSTTTGVSGAKAVLKKVWEFRIVDKKKLFEARPDLLLPDLVQIRKMVTSEGVRELDGVEIYQVERADLR